MKNLATLVIADIVLVERIRIAAFQSGRPNLLFYFIFFLKSKIRTGTHSVIQKQKKNLGIRTNKKKKELNSACLLFELLDVTSPPLFSGTRKKNVRVSFTHQKLSFTSPTFFVFLLLLLLLPLSFPPTLLLQSKVSNLQKAFSHVFFSSF